MIKGQDADGGAGFLPLGLVEEGTGGRHLFGPGTLRSGVSGHEHELIVRWNKAAWRFSYGLLRTRMIPQ
jgi:hypothetical protein